MGLMKWMMKKGTLGGIARSTGELFRYVIQQKELGSIEQLLVLSHLRYMPPQVKSLFPFGSLKSHAYVDQRVKNGKALGLLTMCFSFASAEMDVAGIENDVAVVLAEVLRESGFSDDQIFGHTYSYDVFREAMKNTNLFAARLMSQPAIHAIIKAQSNTSPEKLRGSPSADAKPKIVEQQTLQKSYPSWAHELAALELENLKFDRSLWDSIVVASRDDINLAKATYIEKRAAMLLAKERGAPAKPAEVRSPQSRPLSNPFQVAAEAVRKLNIIEVRMRVIVDPSICKESDGGGNTLLLIAASVGALAILEFLLANGSDPLHRNSAGKTAIDLVRGNLSIVDFNRDRLVRAIEAKISEISAGRSANQAPPLQASSIGDAESRCPHCGATVRFHAHTLRCPGCFRTLFNT
jgi:hypothetical protein